MSGRTSTYFVKLFIILSILSVVSFLFFFFFQAEDGIRDGTVTGVQTCALPIFEALRALARIPTARAAELALSVLERQPVDGFLDYALWQTINDLAEPWAAAVESGAWKIEGREKQLQYALKAIEPKLASGLMAKVVGQKPLPRDGSGGLLELIGQAGGPAQLRQLFDQALGGGFTDEAT